MGAVTTVVRLPLATRRASDGTGRPFRVRLALFAAVTLLAASNVVSNRLWPEGYLVWNLAMTGVLLLVARGAGLTAADLGLGNGRLRRGLACGGLAAVAVGLVYGTAVAMPATRAAFVDARAAAPLAAVVFAALVRIPFGTVLLEELAFRGVLPALVGGGWWRATLVSSGLFGLWHVLPSMGAATSNAAIGGVLGTWGTVIGTVAFTAAAGVVFRVWQRWSGHLVTPMLLHAATNSLGVLVAWWVVNRAHP
jgi:membrane protease YdiL (CAAX protease family)